MKPNIPLLVVTLVTATLITFNTAAQQLPPQPMDNRTQHMSAMQSKEMAGHDMSKMQGQDMKGHSAGSMELHKIMSSGMKMPMNMSGDVDKDFATMMTMHHQQAIKMADVLIKHGGSAELKAMARKMNAAQEGEIKQMAPYTK